MAGLQNNSYRPSILFATNCPSIAFDFNHINSMQHYLLFDFSSVAGFSYYAAKVERLLSKLLSRGEGRSALKYIMNALLSDFEYLIEKKFHLSTRVWISILSEPKLLPRG